MCTKKEQEYYETAWRDFEKAEGFPGVHRLYTLAQPTNQHQIPHREGNYAMNTAQLMSLLTPEILMEAGYVCRRPARRM